jgi:hypothetical protein
MGAELTVRQKILVSAVALGEEIDAFSVEDLIVRCWNLFPEAFSLRGYFAKHPDSNRVLAKLSGADGLCGLGWLEHTDQRMYRVTRKGRVVSKQLLAILAGNGNAPVLVPAPEAIAEETGEIPVVKSIPAPTPKKEEARVAAPRAPRQPRVAKADKGEAQAPVRPAVMLAAPEVMAIGAIAKGAALGKFLRGSPLTFSDACSFWGITASRTTNVQQRLDAVEDLLKRVVESFGSEGATDPRLPPLSTCYGLLNLHRLMLGRFSRELESMRMQLAAG